MKLNHPSGHNGLVAMETQAVSKFLRFNGKFHACLIAGSLKHFVSTRCFSFTLMGANRGRQRAANQYSLIDANSGRQRGAVQYTLMGANGSRQMEVNQYTLRRADRLVRLK